MKTDKMFMLHIRDEILFLEENTKGLTFEKLDTDKVVQHFVQKSLEIIGEASKKLSDEQKARCPAISWKSVSGMRDRLTHGYFDINWEMVWYVLQNDIQQLKKGFINIISAIGWE